MEVPLTHLANTPIAKAEAEIEGGQKFEWELYRDNDGKFRWWLTNGEPTGYCGRLQRQAVSALQGAPIKNLRFT